MKKYYSLLTKDTKTSLWCAEFGDYDKAIVIDEKQEFYECYSAKIICTNHLQIDIDNAINALNIGK